MNCGEDNKPVCPKPHKIPLCPRPKPKPKFSLSGICRIFQNMGCLMSLIKTSIIFGAGLYTGVYIAQNYQIDKVEDPKALLEKLQAFIKSKTDDGK